MNDAELKEAFRENSKKALDALLSIIEDPEHEQLVKACEVVLNRGHGLPPVNDAESFMLRYLSGEITALQCGLLMESQKLHIGDLLASEIHNEQNKMKQEAPENDVASKE